MQISDIPSKFSVPFANAAGAGYIRTIPPTPSGTPGQAALSTGFPPENFNPVSAGGVPPFGQDFNGILNQMSAWDRWAATGAFPPYDPTWQAAVGGYPQWSCVGSLVEFGLIWISMVDNNLTNPDTGGAGWFAFARIVTANKDLYVNAATGNDNNNGLTPATAMATIQGAVTRAFNYPPSQYTITIHVSDGTYGPVLTPKWSGPNIIIDGNATTPANVIISNPSGPSHCVNLSGPNTMTVQNLTVANAGNLSAGGFVASTSGASLSTINTRSNAIATGAVWEAYGGGNVNISGNHFFNGSASEWFWATFGGVMQLATGITLTAAAGISTVTTALAQQGGILSLNPPNASFAGSPLTAGQRYSAVLNGLINVNGGGANVFPGVSAGTTATGGQYS